MQNTFYFKALALVAASGVIMACSSDRSGTTVPTHAAVSQQHAADWITSPQKHNHSGIAMRYKIDGVLAVGKPVTLSLEFSGAQGSDAQATILAPKALTVGEGTGLQKMGDGYRTSLKTHEMTARSLTFTPTSEGEHFVSIQLSQNGQTSAAGVMLRVGERTSAPDTLGQRVTSETGEKLIVMPAK